MPSRLPFPGMDSYLEHPTLWPGVHNGLLHEIVKQLAAPLRPRYAVSIEQRVYREFPSDRFTPTEFEQETGEDVAAGSGDPLAIETDVAAPVEALRGPLEVRERYLAILDLDHDGRVVTVIDLVSPRNKRSGPGREAYLRQQGSTMRARANLVEIDLLRAGMWTVAFPGFLVVRLIEPPEYMICVMRAEYPLKNDVIASRLRYRLPKFNIPLAASDPEVELDLQAAFKQTYEDGSYMQRVKYDEPCLPRLPQDDQTWATEQWNAYRAEHPEWFPPRAAASNS